MGRHCSMYRGLDFSACALFGFFSFHEERFEVAFFLLEPHECLCLQAQRGPGQRLPEACVPCCFFLFHIDPM